MDPTSDLQSPVSFLSLPVEIRLLIYPHLLISPLRFINRTICRSLRNQPEIIRFKFENGSDEYHQIYPEIVATCSLINREGTPILYGKNMFWWLIIYPTDIRILSCCGLAQHIHLITRICLFRPCSWWFSNGQTELRIFRKFPSLKELHIDVELSDFLSNADFPVEWKLTMVSAAQKQPKLTRVSCRMKTWVSSPQSLVPYLL